MGGATSKETSSQTQSRRQSDLSREQRVLEARRNLARVSEAKRNSLTTTESQSSSLNQSTGRNRSIVGRPSLSRGSSDVKNTKPPPPYSRTLSAENKVTHLPRASEQSTQRSRASLSGSLSKTTTSDDGRDGVDDSGVSDKRLETAKEGSQNRKVFRGLFLGSV